MKDVWTTVDMTMIPVFSLTSMALNQVHATLHSDQSSCMKQHKMSNDRERGKRGENEGVRRASWKMTRGGG
jgi:hypothetical protein